ncbi:MAG TPA: hypothetical protein VIG47_05500, partial [Gemmatimonadaceae bacterium]
MRIKYEHDYVWSVLKDGRRGTRLIDVFNAYSPLYRCQLCGLLASAKRVCCRNDVWSWNFIGDKDYTSPRITDLCVSCWNKVKPISYMKREAAEFLRLSRKLLRE